MARAAMSKKIKQTKRSKVSGKIEHPLREVTTSAEIIQNGNKVIKWIELGVATALLLVLFTLHVTIFQYSGGLWRDEVNSVNLVNLPSMVDFWEKFQSDSFPILWFLLLKVWIFIGFGGTDLALRAMGLIIGLGTLGALWYSGRSLGTRLPMISLVLFAMSPTAFVGDSLRAYGLGFLLILLSLGTMWRVLRDPTARRMAVSAVAVILSVQCLYSNSFLIFAICMGAVAVCIYRHHWKLTIFPLGVGMLAAASVLPYIGTVSRASDWDMIVKIPVTLSWIFYRFREAIDPSGALLTWIWFALALLAVIAFILVLVKSVEDVSGKQKDLAVFLLVTMPLGIIAYIVFIKILSYPTQAWYYLPLMAVLIIIIERGIDIVCNIYPPGRIIRIMCILGMAIFVFMNSWDAAHTRKTNMDVLAAKLASLSDKDDLIVVCPFYFGVSFAYYYKGSTPWVTIPEIAEQRVHSYDMFKIKMMQTDPIKSIIQKMTKTLQNGHRVWLVGGLNFLREGETPRMLPPAPNSPYGWSEGMYQIAWSEESAFTLQTHGQTLEQIRIPIGTPVNKLEDVPLLVVQGWRP
jgi:hypothetical protein